jgi:hypothetical protein
MARVLGIFNRTPAVATVFLDVIETRSIDRTQELTKHPIETGQQISDHVIKAPIVFTLRGVMGNAPLETGETAGERARNAYDALTTLFEEQTLIEIQTDFETLRSMIITSLTPVESAPFPGAMTVDIVAEQVTITNTQEVRTQPSNLFADGTDKRASSTQQKGLQKKLPVSATPTATGGFNVSGI